MRPRLSDIHRRIEAVTASSQTPVIVFVKAICQEDGVIDQTVYNTIEEAITAFEKAHKITLDDKSIILIDDIPSGIEEKTGSKSFRL